MTDPASQAFEYAYRFALEMLKRHELIETHQIDDAVEKAVKMVEIASPGATVDDGRLRRELVANVNVYRPRSTALDGEFRDWLPDRIRDIEWTFWRHYREWLEQQGRPLAAIDEDDRTTEDILRRLEDPQLEGVWDRRGLVVGSVQMGKTSNYTGLICKAADAGYKIIVILAGLHNSLRSQTQQRLDEGFLGIDSATTAVGTNTNRFIGVGSLAERHPTAWTFTTSEEQGDFKRKVAENIIGRAGRDPMLFVVKKNKSVMENLINWLLDFNGQERPEDGRKVVMGLPILVIDDEADNASVNTRDVAPPEYDEDGRLKDEALPSKINELIRRLLFAFEQSSYVGYTATPFANIFIEDLAEGPTIGEDLFPRSFIIRMKPPSNYMGPTAVFGISAHDDPRGQGRAPLAVVRTVEDHEAWIADRHKKTAIPGPVPRTLQDAILSFVLVCAARAARGEARIHNSMLVHVTRFVAVQGHVARQVQDEVDRIRNHVRYGSGSGGWDARAELKRLWNMDFDLTSRGFSEDFAGTPLTWADVKEQLVPAVSKIEVRTINGTAADSLAYRRHPDGFSVIAVGGDKLSRGLTLEGLSVSYYLRASRMYDTLMQMGRWFGYRPGYADLCRLYTTRELQLWYAQISAANEELLAKFDEMADAGARPPEFALFVRESPDGLLITARTKMRNGRTMRLSYSGDIVETILFRADATVQAQNRIAVERLLDRQAAPTEDIRSNLLFRDVDGRDIADFLAGFTVPDSATKANSALLAEYIERRMADHELMTWTVNLVSNPKPEGEAWTTIGARPIGLTYRQPHPGYRPEPGMFVIRRLASPVDELSDLDEAASARAMHRSLERFQRGDTRAQAPPTAPYGPEIRFERDPRNGLLIIYPLNPEPAGIADQADYLPAFAISFPISPNAASISYRVPNRYWDEETGGLV